MITNLPRQTHGSVALTQAIGERMSRASQKTRDDWQVDGTKLRSGLITGSYVGTINNEYPATTVGVSRTLAPAAIKAANGLVMRIKMTKNALYKTSAASEMSAAHVERGNRAYKVDFFKIEFRVWYV